MKSQQRTNLIAILLLTIGVQARSADHHPIGTVHVKLRDGVALATSVTLPSDTSTPFPVIFLRTPYGKEAETDARLHYTASGYALVTQDCRGTGESEGAFEPYLHEKDDGYDALEWISNQPWCDGNVGMIGASYEGQVQWLAAASAHPMLKTIIPQVSGTDPFLDVPYDHGILKLSMIDWAYHMSHPGRADPDYVWDRLFTLPITMIDDAFYGVDVPLWDQWTRMDDPADWMKARFLDDMAQVDIPILYVSGNWDVEALSTQLNWLKLRAFGKKHQHLLFGPWEHTAFLGTVPTTFSGVEHGAASRLDFEDIWLAWFDRWLKGKDNGVDLEEPVQFFITGRNEWAFLEDWPSSTYRTRTYHLDLTNEQQRWYSLDTTIAAPASAEYVYVPQVVRLNMDPEFSETAYYARDTAAGNDLAMLSAPFTRNTVLAGPAYVDLEFALDQPDADVFVLIAEVDTAGRIRVLGHPGKMRAMFRDQKELRPVVIGQNHKAKVDLFPFAHEFSKGSRLAVIVRSDWFPRYLRNSGTGQPIATNTELRSVTVGITSASQLILYELVE